MSDVNNVVISGRVVADAVCKTFDSFNITKFSIASNRKVREETQTVFVDVEMFNKEQLAQYLTKGKHIIITGELSRNSWEKDGTKFEKLYLKVFKVDFMPGGKEAPAAEDFEEGHHE